MSTAAPWRSISRSGRVASTCSKPSAASIATLRPVSRSRRMASRLCTPSGAGKGHLDSGAVPGCSRGIVDATRETLVEQLRALGVVPGDVLLVHSSFRALRPVKGGPQGVIDALVETIGPSGTLVMPSWTGRDDLAFDPSATAVATDL